MYKKSLSNFFRNLKLEKRNELMDRVLADRTRYITVALENIEVTAIENLREKYGGMVAKKIGGHVAKYLIADQIGRNDSLLGLAAYVALLAADQADCRSWQLLPQSLQVARIALDPGSYRLSLHTSRGVLQEKMIVLDKKQKVFVNMRFTP